MKMIGVTSEGWKTMLRTRIASICTFSAIVMALVCMTIVFSQTALAQNKTVVVFAPHPDDEALCCSGVISAAKAAGNTVKIVVVTNGDYYGYSTGFQREAETVAAMSGLGLTEQDIIFLGYGDQTLLDLYQSTSPTTIITSAAGQTQTYANRGLGGVDYHTYLHGTSGSYNRQTVLADIEDALRNLHPDEIYTTGLYDVHPDHQSTFTFVTEAILALKKQGVALSPRLHETLIHAPCAFCGVPANGNYMWPGGGLGILPRFTPAQLYAEPYYMSSTTPYEWNRIESILVPTPMQISTESVNLKAQTISKYASQGGSDPDNYLFAFAKKNEFFWVHDYVTNLAGLATVTVSSQTTATGQIGTSAVDGFVEGDPDGYQPFEWATNGELNGAWITLTWPNSVTISRVALYDRPNLVDNVVSGTLRFSDGSSVPVGQLPNNGNSLLISFFPKNVRWMTFNIDNAVGNNTGLAEIEVYGAATGTTVNHPQIFQGPTASAPFQNDQYGQPYAAFITDAQTTNLAVTAFDVNGQTPRYSWTTDSGRISGNGSTVTFNPPVVGTSSLVRATVTVSDASGASVQNSTFVNVTPSNSSGTTISSITLNPTSVASGSTATGTVVLGRSPTNGAIINLTSSNPAIASVPQTVVVAPGANKATFTVSTVYVSTTTTVNITATLGTSTRNATLTVLQPSVILSSLTANPPTVGGGNPSTGTVTLNAAAPTGGAVITLSSNLTTVATIPTTVTVPAGATSAAFPITTQAVTFPSSVTLSANYVGGTLTTSLRVAPYVAPNLATIATVTVSSETPAYQQLGIKAVDGIVDGSPSPGDYTKEWATNGQLAGAWIRLTWTGPVSTSQVVLYDRPNATDNVTSGTLSFSDGSTVPVGALPNGGTALTVSFAQRTVTWVQFTVNSAVGQNIGLSEIAVLGTVDPTSLGTITLSPASVGGGTSSTGTATLNGPAPTSGALVTLGSSNSSVATVPVSITVPAGSTYANFAVNTTAVSSTTAAVISGSYNGIQMATLTVNPLTVTNVSLSPAIVTGGTSVSGTVTLGGIAPAGGALVTLVSTNPSAASVPANITIAAGASSGTFTVSTSAVGAQTTASISATYNLTQAATLTINPLMLTSFVLNPTMVAGGSTSTGTVTLNGAAPAGGITVALASENTAAAQVPANMIVAGGATTGTFTVTTSAVGSTMSAVISGTYNGTQTATLLVTPAIGGGGGMQQFANDSFNRADGSLGPNWTTVLDSGSPPAILSQQIQSGWGRAVGMYYGGINWPADQYAQAQINALGIGSVGPAVRMTSNGYFYAGTVGTFGTGNANVYILLDNNSSLSVIGSSSSATVMAGDYLQISAQGTTLTLTNVTRSTTLLTATDSSLTVGYPGFYVGGAGGTSLTNWSAGLAAAPPSLTTLASDDFTRVNAPNLGVNWAVGFGLYSLQIVNDQIQSAGQGQAPGQGHGKEYYVGVSFPSDQWSQAQVVSSQNDVNGAIVRYQGTADTHYVGFVSRTGVPGTCSVSIDRDINGAPVVLATDTTYCNVAAGDYLRLQVQGSLLSYIDATTGALLLTVTDSQITGGSPGWSLNPVGGTPTADNWTGGGFSQ
jgi:LmbE family N-acetylglucosaminyl deacetylase